MTPRPLDDYLREKLTVHVAAVLEPYLANLNELWLATDDIIEVIEQEITWAAKPEG
jgi:hypothetical protein